MFVRSIEFDSVVDGGGNGAYPLYEERRENQDEDHELFLADSTSSAAALMKSPKATQTLFPPPPQGMTEIPTCAVCLDRLDASASGILTTLCNHTFHCDCLFRWEGSSCPVCRYSHGDIISACEVRCHDAKGVEWPVDICTNFIAVWDFVGLPHNRSPVDLPDLRPRRLRTVLGRARQAALPGDAAHVLTRAGDPARVGLRWRRVRLLLRFYPN